jgi:hypothetical protein
LVAQGLITKVAAQIQAEPTYSLGIVSKGPSKCFNFF